MHKTALFWFMRAVMEFRGRKAKREFEKKTSRCAETQEAVLLDKVGYCADTEYGRLHGFSSISTPDEYRRSVPIVEYKDLAPRVERIVAGEKNVLFPPGERLLMFAMTSGTTAVPKYVPVTERYLRDLLRGNLVWAVHLLHRHPAAIDHKILHVISPSREGVTGCGVPCGAATGLVAESQNKIAHLKYALPAGLFGITDYRTKYYCAVRMALRKKISVLIAANPSTLVALGSCLERNAGALIRDLHDGTLSVEASVAPEIRGCLRGGLKKSRAAAARLENIAEREGKLLPRDVWPELEVIACWTGGTLTPYLDLVRDYWGEKPLRDPGLIASEGRMTIPVEDGPAGGVLDIAGNFYEFLPFDEGPGGGRTLLAHELEEGKRYYIILTTSSGFFRYNINDVVQVTGRFGDTPVLKFLHKGSRISSLTGEKISEYQVVQAFQACERELGLAVPLFTICPGWEIPPFYHILLEERADGLFSGRENRGLLNDIAERFDRELSGLNMEYTGKRDSGRLGKPRVRLIERGAFERGKAEHVARSGGRLEQYKHPYLQPQLDHHKKFREVTG